MEFDPLDSKRRYLEKLMGRVSGSGLKEKYGPKPAPAPAAPALPTEPAAPADPLDGIDLDALSEAIGAKPKGDDGIQRDILTGVRLGTPGYDPNRKDEYGQTIPMNGQHQYTPEGLKRMRAADPEWPDKKRELNKSVRAEEE